MTSTNTYANTHFPLPKDSPTVREIMDMIRKETEKAARVPLFDQIPKMQIIDYIDYHSNPSNRLFGNHEEEFKKHVEAYAAMRNTVPKEPIMAHIDLSSEEYKLMVDLAIEIIQASPEPKNPTGRCAITLPNDYYIVFDKVERPKNYAAGFALEFGKVDHDTNTCLMIKVIDSRQVEKDELGERIIEAFTFREEDEDFPAVERIALFFEKYAKYSFYKSIAGDTGEWAYDKVRQDYGGTMKLEMPKPRNYGLKGLYYMQPIKPDQRLVALSNV